MAGVLSSHDSRKLEFERAIGLGNAYLALCADEWIDYTLPNMCLEARLTLYVVPDAGALQHAQPFLRYISTRM